MFCDAVALVRKFSHVLKSTARFPRVVHWLLMALIVLVLELTKLLHFAELSASEGWAAKTDATAKSRLQIMFSRPMLRFFRRESWREYGS